MGEERTRMALRPDFDVALGPGDRPGERVISVRGELDSGTCDAVLKAFRDAIDEHAGELVLDLRDVSFIDSTGTRAMIEIEQSARERGVGLVVIPPPEDVTALLRTAGVTDRVRLAPSPTGEPHAKGFIERLELEFPRDPLSPGKARAEVREALADKLDDVGMASVVLLTSELVTNAVIHPAAAEDDAIGLRVMIYKDSVRIEVEDSGHGFDPAAPVASAPDGGRGLFLVDSCSAKWGARHTQTQRGRRFRVWFELEWESRQQATATGE